MDAAEAVNCGAFDAEAALLALGPRLEWAFDIDEYFDEAGYSELSGRYFVAESGRYLQDGETPVWVI